MADEPSNKTRPSLGAGLTLVSTLGPTLGFPLPFWLRWILFAAGVILMSWPLLQVIFNRARKIGMEPIHLQIAGLVGVILFAVIALGGLLWQSQASAVLDTQITALKSQLTSSQDELAEAKKIKRPQEQITVAPAPSVVKPRYETAEIGRMITALGNVYDLLAGTALPAADAAIHLSAVMRFDNKTIDQMLGTAKELDGKINKVWTAVLESSQSPDARRFSKQLGLPIEGFKEAHEGVSNSLRAVIGPLDAIKNIPPETLNYRSVVMGSVMALDRDGKLYKQWVEEALRRIERETSELRAWKND